MWVWEALPRAASRDAVPDRGAGRRPRRGDDRGAGGPQPIRRRCRRPPRRRGGADRPTDGVAPSLAQRRLSGGEKKRNETLQLAVLRPRIAVLDELDSGLDVDALRACSKRIEVLTHRRRRNTGPRRAGDHPLQPPAHRAPSRTPCTSSSRAASSPPVGSSSPTSSRPTATRRSAPTPTTTVPLWTRRAGGPRRPLPPLTALRTLADMSDTWIESDGALRRRFEFADFSGRSPS